MLIEKRAHLALYLLGRISPEVSHFNELLLFVCRRHEEANIATDGRTMPPFHGCPLCTDLCIVWPLLGPLHHSRPGQLAWGWQSRWQGSQYPPLVHTTIEGHGHRHLFGSQEAEKGDAGAPTDRWCCQRLSNMLVAFTADKGLAEVSSF